MKWKPSTFPEYVMSLHKYDKDLQWFQCLRWCDMTCDYKDIEITNRKLPFLVNLITNIHQAMLDTHRFAHSCVLFASDIWVYTTYKTVSHDMACHN